MSVRACECVFVVLNVCAIFNISLCQTKQKNLRVSPQSSRKFVVTPVKAEGVFVVSGLKRAGQQNHNMSCLLRAFDDDPEELEKKIQGLEHRIEEIKQHPLTPESEQQLQQLEDKLVETKNKLQKLKENGDCRSYFPGEDGFPTLGYQHLGGL
eukprot:c9048_g1_i1.p1 GENE.c9048_g1_i1~~c9048_g1_i1.p1  ORF type:complete len:153 (+),score=41.68 c9048_g1_i1:87-545(+)